jgi:hypothetical protein
VGRCTSGRIPILQLWRMLDMTTSTLIFFLDCLLSPYVPMQCVQCAFSSFERGVNTLKGWWWKHSVRGNSVEGG